VFSEVQPVAESNMPSFTSEMILSFKPLATVSITGGFSFPNTLYRVMDVEADINPMV
jgi:hypothetical protein